MRNRVYSLHDHRGIALDNMGKWGNNFDRRVFNSPAFTDTQSNLYQTHATRVKRNYLALSLLTIVKKSDFNNDGSVFEGILNIRFYLQTLQI